MSTQVQHFMPTHIPPHMKLVFGKWVSMLLDSMVRLEIPDLLADGQPRTADELAERCGANPDRLYRAMRALTNDGVFVEHEGRRFTLGEAGQYFRKDHPMSAAATAKWLCGPDNSLPWLNVLHGIRTGESPALKAYDGRDPFEYMSAHPETLANFQDCMTSLSRAALPGIINAYKDEWSKFHTICDVGGGHGMLLSEVIKAAGGDARGILYELPQVAADAAKVFDEAGVSGRVECRVGNFFEGVPKGVDLYMMKYIIHDHDDEKCIKILKHCCAGLNPKGRVLVIDAVIPGPNTPAISKYIDCEMFVMVTGRERTEQEFSKLFSAAGLRLTRVIRAGMVDLIEGEPIEGAVRSG